MGRLSILIVILLLGAIALFSISNKDMTSIDVPFGNVHEISKIGLILISCFAGAISMLLIFVIRDAKRLVANIQSAKRQKRLEKTQTLYSRALNAAMARRDAEARGLLEEVLHEDPSHADSLLRLGDLEARRARNKDATGYYRKALSINPNNIEALFALESACEKQGLMKDAASAVEDILEIDNDNLGALYVKRGLLERDSLWDEVIDIQKTILKQSLDSSVEKTEQQNLIGYRYEYARDSLEKGGLEKAVKGFKSIIRDEPSFTPAHLGIAEALLLEGDSEPAVAHLEKTYEQTRSKTLLARLEDLLITLGEPSRLIRLYKKSISENPDDAGIRFFLGKLYFRLEMIDDAIETLMPLQEMIEPYPELNSLMGELYLRRSQCEKAVAEFKKTMQLKKTLRMPYTCSLCGTEQEQWAGRCPSCGYWNTLEFRLDAKTGR